MSSVKVTSTHPRRRPLGVAAPPRLPSVENTAEEDGSSSPQLSKDKAATFHSPSNRPGDSDPTLDFPSLPRRTPTSSKALEPLVTSLAPRVADALASFENDLPSLREGLDNTTAGYPAPSSTEGTSSHRSHFLRQFDESTSASQDRKTEEQTRREIHHHTSDSGLGTSIRTRAAKLNTQSTPIQETNLSTINKSFSSDSEPRGTKRSAHELSPYAEKNIKKYLIVPLLSHNSAKEFQTLIKNTAGRLTKKEYACLRDVEKSLLCLSPGYAKSIRSFMNFCEILVQCLYNTHHHLSGRDLQRPSDRPYSNPYFIDLVGQIRQYAANMAAHRARTASGDPKCDEDLGYSSNEEILLEGGYSENGRPAELVRQKGERSISLATGMPYAADKPPVPTFKRELSETTRLAEAERSMARRKKNAPPEPIKYCSTCNKPFKRECDLTKHLKTHLRPYKCRVEACDYYTKGFPTEKECERHMNDKHSDNPTYFYCDFEGCVYKSKRDSNLKQHKEKAHNWNYARTKANGKNRHSLQSTPRSDTLSTPNYTDFPTPSTANHSSPSVVNYGAYDPMSNTFAPPSMSASPMQPMIPMFESNGYNTLPMYADQQSLSTPDSGLQASLPSPHTPHFATDFETSMNLPDFKMNDSTFDIRLSEGFTSFLENLQVGGPSAKEVWSGTTIDQSPYLEPFMDMADMQDQQQFAHPPAAPRPALNDNFNDLNADFVLFPGQEDSLMNDPNWTAFYGDSTQDDPNQS